MIPGDLARAGGAIEMRSRNTPNCSSDRFGGKTRGLVLQPHIVACKSNLANVRNKIRAIRVIRHPTKPTGETLAFPTRPVRGTVLGSPWILFNCEPMSRTRIPDDDRQALRHRLDEIAECTTEEIDRHRERIENLSAGYAHSIKYVEGGDAKSDCVEYVLNIPALYQHCCYLQ